MIITTIAAKDLQRQADELDGLAVVYQRLGEGPPYSFLGNALLQAAGTIRFLSDALQTNTLEFPKDEQLASAAIIARQKGYWYFCFECLEGFNGTFCPRCDQAESDI